MEKEKNILKKQTSVKVILNGGKFELDDATIPFQIGFDPSIAEKNPVCVLVVDITQNILNESGERATYYDYFSDRKFFKLEPVQYLQLTKPGVHHLIFIIFGNLTDLDKEFILKKNSRNKYENSLYFNSIETLEMHREIAYCEAVISVPEEFFAFKPEAGIKKIIWKWVNLWHSFDPIDQCEYRKRTIFAFTTQPIFWLIGFLFRLPLVILWTIFFIVFKTFSLIIGYQPIKFIPYKKRVWLEFLFCYPRENFNVLCFEEWMCNFSDDSYEESYYPFKTLVVGKKTMHTPITIAELVGYSILFSVYIFTILNYIFGDSSNIEHLNLLGVSIATSSLIGIIAVSLTLPTFKESERWKHMWNFSGGKKLRAIVYAWIFSTLTGISLLVYMITQISWVKVFSFGIKDVICLTIPVLVGICYIFLHKFLTTKVKKIIKNNEQKQVHKKSKKLLLEEKHKEWLLVSFNIKNLPKKVSLKLMPEPSNPVHKFIVKFWQTKAKVCKPYSK